MSDNYARKSRLFFAKQHVYAQATTESPSGVDSEEAELIQQNYRKALGGQQQMQQQQEQNASRVLILREPTDGRPPTVQ
jgi:hypothetical protein